MPPLRLDGIKRFVENQMSDEVIITRDLEGTTDDVFNEATGEYVKLGGDDQVWYHGKAMLLQLNVFPTQLEEGGGTTLSTDFEIHIPIESPTMTLYDRITVLKCDRTPHLVGTEFRVRSRQDNTFSVSQAVRLYRWEQKVTR